MKEDEAYLQTLVEDIDDRFDLILELLTTLKDIPEDLKDVKEMLIRLQQDHDLFYQTVKAASHT